MPDCIPSSFVISNILPAFQAVSTTVHAHLSKANIYPAPANVLADLATLEPVGTWYSIKAVATEVPAGDAVGNIFLPTVNAHWSYGSSTSAPETVYCYFITDTTDAVLLSSGRLPADVTMENALSYVDVESELGIAATVQS